jgi:hypothetical protein
MTSEHASEKETHKGRDHLAGLCRIGGIAAMLLLIYSLAMMVQMVFLGGQPASATQAFDLLQHHRAVALLRLDLPTVAALPLYYLLFLGLFVALRKSDRANALLSTALAFAGVTLVLATPTALSMVQLSDKFAAATSDAADICHSTGAILGGVLLQCGAVLISVVMLRGAVFSKVTAWLGIIMHGLDLAHIVGGLFLPVSGVILLAIAGPLYPFWFLLVGLRLLRLASSNDREQLQV